jgi:hypothetical protein
LIELTILAEEDTIAPPLRRLIAAQAPHASNCAISLAATGRQK